MRSLPLLVALALGLAACTTAAPSSSPSPSAAVTAAPASAPASPAETGPAAVGRAYVDALARGDTAAAEAMQDDTMRAAAPAAALGQLWEQLIAQFGAFREIGAVTTTEQAPYTTATVQASFEDFTVPLLVTVAVDGRVAGFHLGQPVPADPGSPSSPSPSPSAASYVRPEAFTETDVTVGAAPWALPGTLSMPEGEGPFPAVVLLAGSGPNDRDETIGPNAPLRDLAWGLASNGIAVLRYDKRTKAHATAMAANVANVTVKEEVVDDALAAIELLRRTPGVDPERVFVAGHSLGGYLAPRIAAQAPDTVAGIALLAAPSSSLARVIVDQYEYLASEAGGADPQAIAALPAIREQAARAESASLSPSTPASDLPLGIPAAYWLDLRGYDPVATAADLPIPILIAQGGRDYQVPPSELQAWRSGLAARDEVSITEYPALDHLLMEGEGPSRPAGYMVAGHVDEALVVDLAGWVLLAG